MSAGSTIQKGVLRPCCARRENLKAERLSSSLVVRVCGECGRRHFEAYAEPGRIGLVGGNL